MTDKRRQDGQKKAAGSPSWALRPQHSETLSALGRRLRSEYQPVIQEPIPERLLGLAERLATYDKSGAGHRST
ncbi:NepR family anti-sigma factor [Microvirga massiliensis]|uniref:NepR family anti-sigma factor n=1 Tax=Microvirga massiliensis TaxID=1033741 RepID=UPI003CC7F298